MKKAFSMITAIFFIVLVSVVAIQTLSTSQTTVSFTSKTYIKEQAEILVDLAKSVALERVLKSGKPDDANGVYYEIKSGIKVEDEFYYPNIKDYQYKITIAYKLPNKMNEMLDSDKNTVLSTITIDTSGGVLKDLAEIKIVRDYLIAN